MGFWDIFGLGGSGQAKREYEKAVAEYEKIGLPPLQAQKLVMENYQNAGTFTPTNYSPSMSEDTQMSDVGTDPRLAEYQMQALSQLQDLSKGGLNAQDKAMMDIAQSRAQNEARGQNEAVMQNMAARGMSGSGNELVNRLMAGQNSANQLALTGSQAMGNAQSRALSALSQYGNMAGQVRGQEFGEKAQTAQAQDLINRFNTANKNQAGMFNAGNQNQAGMFNLQNKQNIMNQNTAGRNQANQYNIEYPNQIAQQQFGNQMSLAGGKAGQYGNMANADLEAQKRRAGFTGQVVGAGGQILGGYLGK